MLEMRSKRTGGIAAREKGLNTVAALGQERAGETQAQTADCLRCELSQRHRISVKIELSTEGAFANIKHDFALRLRTERKPNF